MENTQKSKTAPISSSTAPEDATCCLRRLLCTLVPANKFLMNRCQSFVAGSLLILGSVKARGTLRVGMAENSQAPLLWFTYFHPARTEICNSSWIHKISLFQDTCKPSQSEKTDWVLNPFQNQAQTSESRWIDLNLHHHFPLKMAVLEKSKSVAIHSIFLKLPELHLCATQYILDCHIIKEVQLLHFNSHENYKIDPSDCEFYQKELKSAIINRIFWLIISHSLRLYHACWQSWKANNLCPSLCTRGKNSVQLPYSSWLHLSTGTIKTNKQKTTTKKEVAIFTLFPPYKFESQPIITFAPLL